MLWVRFLFPVILCLRPEIYSVHIGIPSPPRWVCRDTLWKNPPRDLAESPQGHHIKSTCSGWQFGCFALWNFEGHGKVGFGSQLDNLIPCWVSAPKFDQNPTSVPFGILCRYSLCISLFPAIVWSYYKWLVMPSSTSWFNSEGPMSCAETKANSHRKRAIAPPFCHLTEMRAHMAQSKRMIHAVWWPFSHGWKTQQKCQKPLIPDCSIMFNLITWDQNRICSRCKKIQSFWVRANRKMSWT